MDKEMLKKLVIEKLDTLGVVSKMRPIHFDILDEQIENVLKYEKEYKLDGLTDNDLPEIVMVYLSQGLQVFENILKEIHLTFPEVIINAWYRGKNNRI